MSKYINDESMDDPAPPVNMEGGGKFLFTLLIYSSLISLLSKLILELIPPSILLLQLLEI